MSLPSRYDIRTLEPKHSEWVAAIIAHSMILHSPAWSVVYANNATQQTYLFVKALKYHVDKNIASGLSLGVFDNEYRFKREESAAAGGGLYWDESDESADGAKLLEQMDFPLVSVALSDDSFLGPDEAKMRPLIEALPDFIPVKEMFGREDTRDAGSWEAKGAGEDYQGKGLMKALAHRTMRDAAERGFRAIMIDSMADAVKHVWANPPPPFRSEIVCSWNVWDCVVDGEGEGEGEAGEKRYPFRPSKQESARVYCILR
ncbi:hypothetical protein PT974_06097 [Cladobotryum mycophilum]|uniref:N-acetyltransferase domain-containing protein n=1 Tax=Cladobotryum mycophilum TaxID=491253 RepID=A0ABR0SKK4_9HYPO